MITNFFTTFSHRIRSWRRRQWLMVGVAVVLLAVVSCVFNPTLQTRFVRAQATERVEAFELERVHVLPWSVTVDALHCVVGGMDIALDHARVRFSPVRLLFGLVYLKSVEVEALAVDLRGVPPSDEPAAPFGGVFPLIDLGYGLRLDTLAAAGSVVLDDSQRLAFNVTGGDVRPRATGTLNLDATLDRGEAGGTLTTTGTLTLGQEDDARLSKLGANLHLVAAMPELPEPEAVDVVVVLTPWRQPRIDEDGVPVEDELVAAGDEYEFALTGVRPTQAPYELTTAGRFDGRAHRISGRYTIAVKDSVAAPYTDTSALPEFTEDGDGGYEVDLTTGALNLDYSGEAKVLRLERVLGDNDALPADLLVGTEFALAASAAEVVLESLATTVIGPKGETLVELTLTDAVTVPTAEPLTVLEAKRTLATLALEGIPVTWANGVLPEPAFTGGALSGRFELRGGGGKLRLVSDGPAGIPAATLSDSLGVPMTLALELEPKAVLDAEQLTVTIPRLTLALDETSAVDMKLAATVPFSGDAPAPIALTTSGTVAINPLAALPVVASQAETLPLPDTLALAFDTAIALAGDSVRIEKLEAAVTQGGNAPFLRAEGKRTFRIKLGENGPSFTNPEGELAKLTIDGVDLGWADPYVPGYTLRGELARAEFIVAAGAGNELLVSPAAPIELRGVDLSGPDGALINDLSLRVSPRIKYEPEAARIDYSGLALALGGTTLLTGSGAATVPLAAEPAGAVNANGRVSIALAALARIPALAGTFEGAPATHDWRLGADYSLDATPQSIRIGRLAAALTVDGERRARLQSDGPLTVRNQLVEGAPLASLVVGRASLDVDDLSSDLVGDLVALGPIKFERFGIDAELVSDGNVLRAQTSKPLRLEGARIAGQDGQLIDAFDLTVSGKVGIEADTMESAIEQLRVTFAARPEPAAIDGSLSFAIQPDRGVPLKRLDAALSGFLPTLLDQPAIMKGHRLRDGRFELDVKVDPDGNIDAGAVLGDLTSDKPLAIAGVEGRATGTLSTDGGGFAFTMPVTGRGKSGETDGLLKASYAPAADKKKVIALDFTSGHLYLNDVLATLASIAPDRQPPPARKPAKAKETKVAATAPAAVPLDATPDKSAFWDILPYRARLSYNITDLYYTDYVIFTGVIGEIGITSNRLALESLSADFHDSPMRFNGNIDFVAGEAAPYNLDIDGSVTDFDLNQFFTELIPGSKPRVEGLFGGKIQAFGQSPNMAQYRNELKFDILLKSRAGVFRPLPPDSGLMTGTSNVLGVVGEGLSYMPTGGFGAGAVSRLVDFIREIDYDRVDIHVVRDDSRDIVIRQFLVRSPTVRLTASGGIDYEDGKDVLDSPLNLDARMNMSGKGAAILYSINLLDDGEDKFGYEKGPEFRIRGTPTAPESNFAEIINTAADGAIKGGILRPLAGLIGNIKHRWFGSDPVDSFDDPGTADGAAAVAPPLDGAPSDPVKAPAETPDAAGSIEAGLRPATSAAAR